MAVANKKKTGSLKVAFVSVLYCGKNDKHTHTMAMSFQQLCDRPFLARHHDMLEAGAIMMTCVCGITAGVLGMRIGPRAEQRLSALLCKPLLDQQGEAVSNSMSALGVLSMCTGVLMAFVRVNEVLPLNNTEQQRRGSRWYYVVPVLFILAGVVLLAVASDRVIRVPEEDEAKRTNGRSIAMLVTAIIGLVLGIVHLGIIRFASNKANGHTC